MSLTKKSKAARVAVATGLLVALGAGTVGLASPASAVAPYDRMVKPGEQVAMTTSFEGTTPAEYQLHMSTIVFEVGNGATFKPNSSVPASYYNKGTGKWVDVTHLYAGNCVTGSGGTTLTCGFPFLPKGSEANYPWKMGSAEYREYLPTILVPSGAALGTKYPVKATMTSTAHATRYVSAEAVATVEAAPLTMATPVAGATLPHVGGVVTGTASAGHTVTVFNINESLQMTVLGTGVAGADGKYSVTLTTPMPEGPRELRVGSTGKTVTRNVLFAAAPRAEIVVSTPATGAKLPKTDVAFAGTAEPNAALEIRNSQGEVLASGVADAQGAWTAKVAGPLAAGSHTFTVVDTHKNGTSTQVTYEVATDALKVLSPQAGETIGKKGTLVSGTAEPGQTVQVKDNNGTILATAKTDTYGVFVATIAGPLPGGARTLTVTDGLGNQVNIDVKVESDALTITSPTAGAKLGKTGIEFAGTAEPGVSVEIKDSKGNVIASGVSNAQGVWTMTVTGPLPAGETTVSVTAGDKTVERTYTVATDPLVVTTPAPGAKIGKTGVEFAGTGEPGATIEIKNDNGDVIATGVADVEGNWSATVNGALPAGSGSFTVSDGERTVTVTGVTVETDALIVTSPTEGTPVAKTGTVLSGTAEPGVTVEIKDSTGNVIGIGTADKDGSWSATVQAKLTTGQNSLTVTDGAHTITHTVTASADPVVITSPAPGSEISATNPEFAGTAEPGATVEIKDVNGTVIGSGTADKDGNWSATVTGTLPEGATSITVTDGTNDYTFDFTVVEPAAPAADLVIVSPADGATIPTTDVVFEGTATPGATVEITDADGNVLATATADTEGVWTVTVPGPLPEGKNTLTLSDGTNTVTVEYLASDDEEGTPMVNSLGGAAAAGLLLGLGALGIRRRKTEEAAA
ncbi:Ig-like domain-containing protein [Microbacterium sp. TPU 3598]|uniref:Ig-like domain-containing protein n=1 Tax=Microbacterium sp. TPU 3598 TaxID=1938334 RepID=UPI00155F863F|nr:Ig-like domain-containing protein [Microbacterium sp. TPU 3598]